MTTPPTSRGSGAGCRRGYGLSRTEYIRRTLSRELGDADADVTVTDPVAFADTFADLADADITRQAWS